MQVDTHQKALRINLDPAIYGTLAEIGAGQEVARWFLRVGGASGTVAKSMSAYDMAFSDAIYGQTVCAPRAGVCVADAGSGLPGRGGRFAGGWMGLGVPGSGANHRGGPPSACPRRVPVRVSHGERLPRTAR
jgi:hypothetical protein